MLVMVPWLASQDGGATVEAVCERFGLKPEDLRADLELLTMYVGIPPYTPDQFFDLSIEGDRVHARVTPALDRPLRLTPQEGLALVVAGQTLDDDPDGPLARGLAKLAGVLGIDPDQAVDVELGPADPGILAVLRRAIAEARQVRIVHYAENRDAALDRTVDPWLVANVAGSWYFVGHDRTRDARRDFRVDRILAADVLDAAASPPPADVEVSVGMTEDAPVVVVDLAPEGRWVAETYPHEGLEALEDGRLRVRLRVGGRAWLERLLLRLGPAASVVEAPDELRDAAAVAARRVLERYR
jgi:proteasome accessory factor C